MLEREVARLTSIAERGIMTKIICLSEYRLSDGGRALLKRFGHKYIFAREYPDSHTPPDIVDNLNKEKAMDMLADTLRADVLELD